MRKTLFFGCWISVVSVFAGCRVAGTPEVMPAVTEKPCTVDFETALQARAGSELWRIEEALAAQKRTGRAKINAETLFFTIVELSPERAARQRAAACRARYELIAAGAEFVRREALEESLRGELESGKADAAQVETLRPLYLANHRAALVAALRLRRMLNWPPEAALERAALDSWPTAEFPFSAEVALTDFQLQAFVGRAELGKFSGNFPDLCREMNRIPTGNNFPLRRFAALPAALAEKRAASPEMDWKFAAAYAAAVGIRQEVFEAFEEWQKCAKAAAAGEAESSGKVELELKRDLTACRLLGALGGRADQAPEKLRPPTPAECLAAAWVTDYLLENGE